MGELRLEICLKDLKEDHACIPLKKLDPMVSYRETMSEESESRCACPSLPTSTTDCTSTLVPSLMAWLRTLTREKSQPGRQALKACAHYLAGKYEWEVTEALGSGALGLTELGPTGGPQQGGAVSQRDQRQHDCCVSVGNKGDAIHHRGGQIISRMLCACQLTVQLRLMEPVYLVEIQVVGSIYSVLNRKQGHVFEESQVTGTPVFVIKAYLPVNESFGLPPVCF
ncbi:elongation factor 2 [Arapaima gigas]